MVAISCSAVVMPASRGSGVTASAWVSPTESPRAHSMIAR
jgi:hypothetical protein